MAKKEKYHVEQGKSEGGANGWFVYDSKGKEVYFDPSKAEAEDHCEGLNGIREYHFSLGNSTKGPIGYCARLKAHSKKEAVEILKRVVPLEVEIRASSDNDEDNATVIYIEAYINEKAIRVSHIDEVN